ncbi:hypothetical protein BJ170DRAFT_359985 [Xylariales sp. AK1849]|nr:hypothetical protein BJ170DRAFT_359985 [Xylariales sp. AK1849]
MKKDPNRPLSQSTDAASTSQETPDPLETRDAPPLTLNETLSKLPKIPVPPGHRPGHPQTWSTPNKPKNDARDLIPSKASYKTADSDSTRCLMTVAGIANVSRVSKLVSAVDKSSATAPDLRPDDWRKLRQDMSRQLMEKHLDRIRRSSRLSKESTQFFEVYENVLRLRIKEILKEEKDRGAFSLAVRKGEVSDHWVIDVMTEQCLDMDIVNQLQAAKDSCLPPEIQSKVQFELRSGDVVRSAKPSSQIKEPDDKWDDPVNVLKYNDMCMGDSIGPDWISSTATLGPMLNIDKVSYWLLNWHPFDDDHKRRYRYWDENNPPSLDALHPSPDDLAKYSPEDGQCLRIGTTEAYSGLMYKTTRSSQQSGSGGPLTVVTDWALVKANSPAKANKVRHIWMQDRCDSFHHLITETADPEGPNSSNEFEPTLAYSVGRSSGLSYGHVCISPADVRHKDGTETREWYVERAGTHASEEQWRSGHMGIPGDSGAGIVDSRTHKLLGQLWGRNRYAGDPEHPRLSYFTRMSDIFDDIQERFSDCVRPTLPQEVPVTASSGSYAHSELSSIGGNAEDPRSLLPATMNGPRDGDSSSGPRRSKSRTVVTVRQRGNWVIVSRHANTWPIPVSVR